MDDMARWSWSSSCSRGENAAHGQERESHLAGGVRVSSSFRKALELKKHFERGILNGACHDKLAPINR